MVCLGMGFHGIYHTFHLLIQDPFPCGTRDGNYRLDTDCFSGGLTIIASLNIVTHEYEDNLRTRQFLSFLIVMAIWSFGLFFIYEQSSEEFLEMACVPASILIAHFFTVNRGKYIFWLFHFSVVMFIALLMIRIWNFL